MQPQAPALLSGNLSQTRKLRWLETPLLLLLLL
jgi:hypothetical protein